MDFEKVKEFAKSNENVTKVVYNNGDGLTRLRISYKSNMELSVVHHPEYSYGCKENLFEIAPYNSSGYMDGSILMPEDQGDDVCGWCDVEKVFSYITRIGRM